MGQSIHAVYQQSLRAICCSGVTTTMEFHFTVLFIIFAAINLHCCCFAQRTPSDEMKALQTILDKLQGGTDLNWDFSVDPCTAPSWSRGSADGWWQKNITCNCSFDDGKICRVTRIRIKTQGLSGMIPPELANLTHLQEIDLTRNYLGGSIPASLGSLSNLSILSVGINRLSGAIPKELGNLSNLNQLVIPSNNLSGTIPSELGNLTKLQQLFIFSNNFVGEIPLTFINLQNMEQFLASSNNFIGKIPPFIGSWKKLSTLELQGTSLEGPIPSIIFSNLSQLTDLRISDITYGASTFPDLHHLNKLSLLVLRNNLISGEIPKYIGEFKSLKTLDLSFNNLTGSIPQSFQNLRHLNYLFLGNNKLIGQYPQLNSNTVYIDLSYNNLSGTIPSWLDNQNINVNLIENFLNKGPTSNSEQGCFQGNFPCIKEKHQYYSLAINCGGPQLDISFGPHIRVFEKDDEQLGASSFYMSRKGNWAVSSTGYFMDNETIKTYTTSTNSQFTSGGLNPQLYRTARISPASLRYYGLRLYNGQYNVQLHFAETQISDEFSYRSLGQRIFDIYIQGNRVLKDFCTKKIGDRKAVVIKTFNASVTENLLEIRLYWAGKGTVNVPSKGIYGPLVSAIIITPNFEVPNHKGNRTLKIVGIIVGVIVALALALLAPFFFIRKRKRRGSKFLRGHKDQELINLEAKSTCFSLRELKIATRDFHPDNKIGEGGFGAVYKGMARDGKKVAIKQLSSKSKQGSREFLNEVGTISAVQHPNLVKLYGCCAEGEELLLVYEYVENNSLANALFGPDEFRPKMDWTARFNICIGVARGLAYLHEESRLRIVHRDIKSTNILLDEHLNPKITDFGLAKLFEEDRTHISTRVAGTVGYMAPEYALRGLLTEKADVYSFGVVALEVVSGRRHTDNTMPEEMVYLLEWTWHLYQEKKVLDVVDVKLHSGYREEEVVRVITVALLCTNPTPSLRPSMSTVVDMLEGQLETHAPRSGPGYLNHYQALALVLGKDILDSPSTQSTSLTMEGPLKGSSSSGTTSLANQQEKNKVEDEDEDEGSTLIQEVSSYAD